VDSIYNYALAESFIATLKTELFNRYSWPIREFGPDGEGLRVSGRAFYNRYKLPSAPG
jgi:hypothetical protein